MGFGFECLGVWVRARGLGFKIGGAAFARNITGSFTGLCGL